MRHIFGLTFLHPNDVGSVFVEDFVADKPNDVRVTEFVDYLVETYIEEDACFPPHIWAANTASIMRTTNTCESFHSKFNSYCTTPHPNIHVFLEALKNMQIDTYVKINSSSLIESNKTTKRNILRTHDFIKNKISQLQNNNISKYDFVKCVSHKYSEIVF